MNNVKGPISYLLALDGIIVICSLVYHIVATVVHDQPHCCYFSRWPVPYHIAATMIYGIASNKLCTLSFKIDLKNLDLVQSKNFITYLFLFIKKKFQISKMYIIH